MSKPELLWSEGTETTAVSCPVSGDGDHYFCWHSYRHDCFYGEFVADGKEIWQSPGCWDLEAAKAACERHWQGEATC